ncbi:MAG: type II toxin-antitoxin system VapC family toxin [Akkermansiaceae bacterium]|nr:type II toxin-antitoxin system VapC family toxin [Akkermansiaceae bacterium]
MNPPGSLALDTSVCIAHLRGQCDIISQTLAEATELYLPLTTLGELSYGYERSGRDQRSRAQLQLIRSLAIVLPPDVYTAECFGRLKSHLASKGRMIPEGDLWIAATAQSYGITLYCRDDHFGHLTDVMDIKQA